MKTNNNKIMKSSLNQSNLDDSLTIKKNMLGYYLAGLIEGDGSIIVPKTIRNQKGKLLYPKVKITFVEKDSLLANKIKEIFNAGTIERTQGKFYINLLFQDLNSIQKIAVLLNGKMRTPKIEALYRLIDWLNAKSNIKSKNIIKLGLDNSHLGNNPWLSGFIEADGNFYCGFNLTKENIANNLKSYMRISQKRIISNKINNKNSNFLIMDKIREFLNIKKVNEIKRIKKDYIELSYEVRTSKILSCEIMTKYLFIYPLFGSKYQDFLSWCKFNKIRLSREYKTIKGTEKLKSIKHSMNTLRTQFNWDSLNRFYSI
jgi:LAGLIDADG endonuclease